MLKNILSRHINIDNIRTNVGNNIHDIINHASNVANQLITQGNSALGNSLHGILVV